MVYLEKVVQHLVEIYPIPQNQKFYCFELLLWNFLATMEYLAVINLGLLDMYYEQNTDY